MSLILELPKEIEAALALQARAAHMPTEQYLARLVERAVESRRRDAADQLVHHLDSMATQVAAGYDDRTNGSRAAACLGGRAATAQPGEGCPRYKYPGAGESEIFAGGLAREVLLAVLVTPHTLILSPPILAETARVLRYPHVQSRWPLTDDAIKTHLSLLEAASFLVEMPAEIPAIVTDPDDDPILQTAIVGRADVLCSRDEAFTASRVLDVCHTHGIRVMDDVGLMHELRKL
ncbi:MAG: putative toxin-antitoxin system toxin component, PIN family [Acidobacteriota bacterium]